jgi:hypothetical protein
MDRTVIETEYLPKSFKTLQEFITKTLKENGDEEDKIVVEAAVEEEKFKVFAKVLHNVQTTYLSMQSHSKVDVGKMIGSMKEDIRK